MYPSSSAIDHESEFTSLDVFIKYVSMMERICPLLRTSDIDSYWLRYLKLPSLPQRVDFVNPRQHLLWSKSGGAERAWRSYAVLVLQRFRYLIRAGPHPTLTFRDFRPYAGMR